MSVAKLARILDQGAKDTHSRILRDHRNGLGPHEETMTQNFISGYVSRIRTAKVNAAAGEFTRWDEARYFGADIALWFMNCSDEFAGVYLQSKILKSDDTYQKLDHTNSHGRQYDTLVSAAARDGVLAGYAFYNGLKGADPLTSACTHGIGSPEISGISIASAVLLGSHVKAKVQRADIEALCSPLSCLVRHASSNLANSPLEGDASSSGSAKQADPDLPRAILGLMLKWQQHDAQLHTRESIPEYVRTLAGSMGHTAEDAGVNVIDAYPERQDYLQAREDEPRFSDINDDSQYFTAVLVGP